MSNKTKTFSFEEIERNLPVTVLNQLRSDANANAMDNVFVNPWAMDHADEAFEILSKMPANISVREIRFSELFGDENDVDIATVGDVLDLLDELSNESYRDKILAIGRFLTYLSTPMPASRKLSWIYCE